MTIIDRPHLIKPSPSKENDQGQLVAARGISREVIVELSKIKKEPVKEWWEGYTNAMQVLDTVQ